MDLDLHSFCDKLAVDDAKKSMLGFANYTVPQIAKLTITATLVKKQRRLQSHSQHQEKLRVRSFHRLLTTSKVQSVPFV